MRDNRFNKQETPLNNCFQLNQHDTVYQGKLIDLTVDRITTASGIQAVREVVVHPGGAAVLPVFPNGDVLLVEQFRYPMRRALLELPAARELEEEVGYRAGRLEKLGAFYTTPGFCTELLHLFLARDLQPGRSGGDEDEELLVHRYSLNELHRLVRLGEIVDAKTLIGLHFLLVDSAEQEP